MNKRQAKSLQIGQDVYVVEFKVDFHGGLMFYATVVGFPTEDETGVIVAAIGGEEHYCDIRQVFTNVADCLDYQRKRARKCEDMLKKIRRMREYRERKKEKEEWKSK